MVTHSHRVNSHTTVFRTSSTIVTPWAAFIRPSSLRRTMPSRSATIEHNARQPNGRGYTPGWHGCDD